MMSESGSDLTGKVAYVTGAGTGIGRGIAEVLARSGADVAVNALTDRYVVDLCERMAKETGRRVVPIVGDVVTNDGARAATTAVLDALGRIDILVNTLGEAGRKFLVTLPDGGEPGISDDELQEVMNLNLMGTIACTRAVGPHFLERRSGKVVTISGIAAVRVGGPGSTIYTTAKTALSGFTRALAIEWAPYNIQVNCVAPGGDYPDPIRAGDQFEARRVATAAKTPLGRAGNVEEIGEAVRFFASSASDYITGQTLIIDGGISLR
jgi:NAD(P)-dependent dehydrogenase (short-subunit alcohol dehydrogenase family)